jgi:hypothetical protein
MKNDRKGDWMQTHTGGQFWPLDPRIEDINILDISASLSKINRYAGHTLDFYSVAEHCVLITRKMRLLGYDQAICREALMHDASEAYIGDIPRPIKPYLKNYAEIENGIMQKIAEKYDFAWPCSKFVKLFDTRILNDEREQAMEIEPEPWPQTDKTMKLNVKLEFWLPPAANHEFMIEAERCGIK